MENSKLLTILVQVDEETKTPFKAHNEILSLFGVVKVLPCGDCDNYAEYDGALKICSNCGTSL